MRWENKMKLDGLRSCENLSYYKVEWEYNKIDSIRPQNHWFPYLKVFNYKLGPDGEKICSKQLTIRWSLVSRVVHRSGMDACTDSAEASLLTSMLTSYRHWNEVYFHIGPSVLLISRDLAAPKFIETRAVRLVFKGITDEETGCPCRTFVHP